MHYKRYVSISFPAESLLAVLWKSLTRFVTSTIESGEFVDMSFVCENTSKLVQVFFFLNNAGHL